MIVVLPFIYFLSKSKTLKYRARVLILENKSNYSKNIDPRINLLFNLKNVDFKFLFENKFLSKLKRLLQLKSSSIFTKIFNRIITKFYIKILKIKLKKLDLKNKLGKAFIKSKSPLIITMIGLVLIRVPLAYLFYSLGLSIEWIYATLIADYFIKGVLLAIRYKSRRWMKVLNTNN